MAQARDLGRFLQSPSARERAARNLAALADLPGHIGPAEFNILGSPWWRPAARMTWTR